MKKELGDCTKRLSLCFDFSNSTGGCSKSMSLDKTMVSPCVQQVAARQRVEGEAAVGAAET
eukprot:CAMPEP_0117666448 /NCGR_PEP_ID=MMETSP0804-20121206/10382_1 /TAXON_ID=1074897 /ORGANISM="Tetraselmis astigmatica, Strain CCMP880" /LENGTH=60 /DNA_ID=CAMNT_0005473995 /DNA_START=445 /DNA_END=623 /DNA_ORIENTATION=+